MAYNAIPEGNLVESFALALVTPGPPEGDFQRVDYIYPDVPVTGNWRPAPFIDRFALRPNPSNASSEVYIPLPDTIVYGDDRGMRGVILGYISNTFQNTISVSIELLETNNTALLAADKAMLRTFNANYGGDIDCYLLNVETRRVYRFCQSLVRGQRQYWEGDSTNYEMKVVPAGTVIETYTDYVDAPELLLKSVGLQPFTYHFLLFTGTFTVTYPDPVNEPDNFIVDTTLELVAFPEVPLISGALPRGSSTISVALTVFAATVGLALYS